MEKHSNDNKCFRSCVFLLEAEGNDTLKFTIENTVTDREWARIKNGETFVNHVGIDEVVVVVVSGILTDVRGIADIDDVDEANTSTKLCLC
jgi:hypothetical protein